MLQLAVVAMIIYIVYTAAIQSVTGEGFDQELHATERSLAAEAISARTTGILQLHTFSGVDYTTQLHKEHISVSPANMQGGKQERITLPSYMSVEETRLTGRGIRWLRAQTRLSLQTTTIQQECPQATISFPEIAIIGEEPHRTYLQTAVNMVWDEKTTIQQYRRLSERRNEPFFIYLAEHEEENILVYTGTGQTNDRIRCVVANTLEEAGYFVTVHRIPVTQPQLTLFVSENTSLNDLQDQLIFALREVKQGAN